MPAHHMLLDFIKVVRNMNHDDPQNEIFSILLLLPPSYTRTASSAPNPRTPSVYDVPTVRDQV
jgi:hypothetical protein